MNDLFSERYGYVTKKLQYEYLNEFSKAHLWDEINWHFLVKAKRMYEESEDECEIDNDCSEQAFEFYYSLNRDFWGQSVDELKIDPSQVKAGLKNIVMNTMWHNTFDVIEAIVRICPVLVPDNKKRKTLLKNFHSATNKVFEEQRCAYRLLDGMIVPNVNNIEIVTITNALVDTALIKTVNAHLEQAVKHYSDRRNPDYRNAIKESISALESLINLIAGSKGSTMSDALKLIKRKDILGLHQALHNSLMSLYGWASDESGIRHYLKEESTIENDDAKLIIVTCCSFVSYLIAKAMKAGIKLGE